MIYNIKCTLNTSNIYLYSLYYSIDILNDLSPILDNADKSNIDKFLYPIHVIYSQSVFNKEYKKRDQFISLSASIIKETIGKKYKKVLQFLIDHNFIECDGIWAKRKFNIESGRFQKGKCLGYRLTEKYRDCQFIIKQTTALNVKREEITNPNHKYLLKLLDDISIDTNLLPEFQQEIEKEAKTINGQNFAKDFFLGFNNKNYHFSTDKKSGRIFNIIVNAPNYLRKFLIYKGGEKLHEIDIRASQPLLLNLLYQESDPIEEKIRFKHVTEKDDFYTFLIENSKLNISRNRAKKLLYYYLFGENQYIYYNVAAIEDFFRKYFPSLLKRIDGIKTPDYTKMAIFLQKAEAEAMINQVVKFCRLNNIPVYPIHDSFMTTKEHINTVRQEVLRVFWDLYKLVPELRIKEVKK
jgi:hypothetical protein